ncbi:MAG: SGNH hydrolase domain-containing protein, partial [Acidimicrobiia bacterium]
ELDPDLIILTHRTYDDAFRLPFVGADDRVVEPDSPDYEQFLRRTSLAALSELSRDGREIVIIEPIPPSPSGEDPLSCLSEGNPAEKCSYEAQRTPTPLELFYRMEARAPNITSVDLDRVVCPSWPTCDAIVGRMITRRDGAHMTVTYARSLASQVGAQIPE